jgi:fatty-acyl-CoA synthase
MIGRGSDPLTQDAAGAHTLGRWISDSARRQPEKVAIDDRGVRITYGELNRRSDELAAALARAGYGAGDRVATVAGNSIEQVVVFFACAKAGLVLVPLSWRLTAPELATNLDTARPSLLLAEEAWLRVAREAVRRCGLALPTTTFGTTGVESTVPDRSLPPGDTWPLQRPPHDDDPLLVIFTSGSEATPKGVVLTHANCFWNNLALARALELTAADVVLATLPQAHVAGWNCQPLAAWWLGATVVLERTFEPSRVLQLLGARGVTTMMGVPTQYHLLAAEPGFADADLSSLRHVVVGGSTMPVPLLQVWADRAVDVIQGYGLTEASPNVLYVPAGQARDYPGAVGWPYPYVEVRITDPETGAVLDGEAVGELQVRGPAVFPGYLGSPEQTAAVFAGEWLRTGDLAARDAKGCHRIVDRLKHIYISGGENVAPAEVEAALVRHPLVAEAAVLSAPHPVWGEVGIAFVQPEQGVRVTAEEVLAHARECLADYKVPREVRVVPELPRTGIGKVARAELRRSTTTEKAEGRP